jgi:hypothetical protein
MRIRNFIIALLLPAGFLFGQDDGTYQKSNLANLLRTQLTITPAWMVTGTSGDNSGSIAGGRTNIYLHGTAEYYFSERFSARGDIFYFVNKDKNTPGGMKHNHCIETGFGWHIWKGSMIDPYIGFSGGLNLAQVYPMDLSNGTITVIDYNMPAHLDPIWGPRIGCNFYGQRIFHYFVEVHYVMGSYRPPIGPSLSINELRVSVGLGLNWVFQHKEDVIRPNI